MKHNAEVWLDGRLIHTPRILENAEHPTSETFEQKALASAIHWGVLEEQDAGRAVVRQPG